jgi:aquaporin Z
MEMVESKEPTPLSCIIAEIVGTYLLVFTIGCCHIAGDEVWDATAIACMFMVVIFSFAAVSGGHFNPAVSFAMGMTNNCAWSKVIFYIVAQLIGGNLAASTYSTIFNKTVPLSYVPGNEWWCACLVETVYTFMLCFVYLNVAASKRNNPKDDQNNFFAFAIGFVLVAGGYAAAGISGAALNPAVAISVDIDDKGFGARTGFIYSAYEFLGALLAGIIYSICRPEDFQSDLRFIDLREYKPGMLPRLLSEFLGTFMLVLTVGLCLANKSTVTAWAGAAALMCMIYALGNISGGHFNPAVTTAVLASGRNKCELGAGCLYMVAQTLAGIAAGVTFGKLHEYGRFRSEAFGLGPQGTWSWSGVLLAELFFTFVLAFVFLACYTVKDPMSRKTGNNFYFALCVGSCMTAGGFAVGAISGGYFNPALSIGVSTGSQFGHTYHEAPPFHYCVHYAVIQLVGGVLASIVFRITHVGEYGKEVS